MACTDSPVGTTFLSLPSLFAEVFQINPRRHLIPHLYTYGHLLKNSFFFITMSLPHLIKVTIISFLLIFISLVIYF